MERYFLNSQMRAADAYTINNIGISSQTLMRRAGESIAEEVLKVARNKNIKEALVVCGTGNNGGDGYVCARELIKNGISVKVYAFNGKLSDDCAREKSKYLGDFTDKIDGDIIVDCIFGTGLTREITGIYADVIQMINNSGAFVVSADIPSGLNGDNGCILGCAVKADLTVAIAEYKAGMVIGDGPDYCGKVIKKDIGIKCGQNKFITVYSDSDIKPFYPRRKRNTHKGSYGSANIIAGSDRYIGAAALASEAALRSGCGYVKLTTTEKVKLSIAPKLPQVIFLEEPDLKSEAISLGMGCGIGEDLYNKIKRILKEYGGTFIIDADGINTLSKFGINILKDKNCKVIMTPHIKEFSRLTGESVKDILKDPIGLAQRFASEFDVVLLLKSSSSIICDRDNIVINTRGSTALSKGGSGDMLSGYICGSVARGLSPFDAAVCAAYTMGLSAEISSADMTDYCVTAKDILKNLHLAVKRLTI